MTRQCIAHDGTAAEGDAVIVGAVEAATSGGRFLYACRTCVAVYQLVPYDEHPEDTDGTPRRRERDRGEDVVRPFIGPFHLVVRTG